MQSVMRPTDTYSEASGGMRFGLSVKKSSKQHDKSMMVKDTVLLTESKQCLKPQDKLKAKSCMNKPYDDLPHELRKHANDGSLVQTKTAGNFQQLSVGMRETNVDELVKYMSNLPGYLQRVEKTENIQDKALNVGVLDWSRLESWKYNQKDTPMGVDNHASLPSCNLSTKMTTSSTFYNPSRDETLSYQSKQHPSLSHRNSSSHNDGIFGETKLSIQDAMRFRGVQNASNSHFDGEKRSLRNYMSFDRNSSNVISEKGKKRDLDHTITSKVEHRSTNCRYINMQIEPKESLSACDREAKQRVEERQGSDIKRKASKQKITSNMGASSSELRNYDISFRTKERKNVDNSRMEKGMGLQESAIHLPSQHLSGDNKNIVLLLPRKSSQISFLKQPRISLDVNVAEADQNTLSDGFSDKDIQSSGFHHEIPHSCPLPFRAEINTKQRETAPDAINAQDAKLSSDAMNTVKFSSGNMVETSKMLENDAVDLAARKGRHPSPNRRFSFSLGRMSRSFSFKENSGVPELSSSHVSVKSGPVMCKASAGLDDSNTEKGSGHNRARSSPFRRILDPLLKSKGSTQPYSSELDKPLRGNLNSYSFKPVNFTESLQNEKHVASSLQAHLLLTRRNGLPLFRFMINNNSIIVAAPMKNSSLGKNDPDPGCNYVLYAIDEINKKSGSWMNQGSKEKSCGFVYNVVGQMKVNSSSSLDLSGHDFNSQDIVKESVLFGVELRQTGQASPKVMPNTELAAVVVKMPNGNSGFNRQQSDREDNVMQKGYSWHLPENENSNRCTVILPGGIHSLPNTGVPSSLIHRWRSGGSCDCGGWDVGCKLRILSCKNKYQKPPRSDDACQTSNLFELHIQGEAQQDKPIFSMAPIEKGKYSVEFSRSISLLQAFFICITVVRCQISNDFTEMSNLCEEKVLQESGSANDGKKQIRTSGLAQAPVKYTPSPPVSPVGRV